MHVVYAVYVSEAVAHKPQIRFEWFYITKTKIKHNLFEQFYCFVSNGTRIVTANFMSWDI